jgi:hypothetical protein
MTKRKPLSERIGVEKVADGEGDTIADTARKASDRLTVLKQNTTPTLGSESTPAMIDEQGGTRSDLGATLSGAESQTPPKLNPDGPLYRSAFKIYHKED